MLRSIEEYGKYVVIAGLTGVHIGNVEDFLETILEEKPSDVHMQFFDAGFVTTWQHLYFAALNAVAAFESNNNISKSVAMESILYASAQRQIRKAMKLLGIKPDSSNIALLMITKNQKSAQTALSQVLRQTEGRRDDSVLGLSEKKIVDIRRIFGISDIELETVGKRDCLGKALTNVVIERVALLAIQH